MTDQPADVLAAALELATELTASLRKLADVDYTYLEGAAVRGPSMLDVYEARALLRRIDGPKAAA